MNTGRALGLLLLLGGPAFAQELHGLLRDPAGSPLPNATVRLAHPALNVPLSQSTAPDGGFHFVALPTGTYTLTVSHPGFATLSRTGLTLRAADRLSLDLTLSLGDVSQSLDVSADIPSLTQSRGTVSFQLDQQRIVNLPIDGRNFVPLIALSPGVNLPPGSTFPRINGSRPRVSEYLYDGISVLQPEPGQVAYFPVIDAIEEFRVEANAYSAEYGRANGGIILVNQKSGTNQFHGTLFEFFRHERLNARNLFANPADTKPRFRRNQYGFIFGGPLRRNRTFFFTDWQGTRQQTGIVRISTVPTLSQRDGRFATPILDPGNQRQPFPANTIPASRFDATARSLLARYPTPTSTATANNYRRTGNERTAQDQFDTRLDHYLGSAHRFFARYAFLRDFSQPIAPLPDGSGNLTAGILGDTLTRADSLVAEHSFTRSATQANQLRFGYTRRGFRRRSLDLPIYDLTGFQQLGPPPSSRADFTTSVTQFLDHYSWFTGPHRLKAGADIRLQTLDVLQPAAPLGNFQFSPILTGHSVASFLLGQVQQFQIDLQEETLQPRARIAEFFLQDDIRLSSRLSLNLGVRYTLNFPSTVRNNRGAVFNLRSQQLDFFGQNGFPRSARNLEYANFAPRIGFALQLPAGFLLRSGYGLTWIEQAGITTPFTTPFFPFIRSLQQASLDNLRPAFLLSQGPTITPSAPNPDSGLGQSVFAVQRDQKSGYAQQWNLSLQKTIARDWILEFGYLGSKLTNLGVPDVNLNQLTVEQLALVRADITRQQLLRPFPRFNNVALYRNNVGHSTYHSLQARLEKRFSRSFTGTLAYTFSRLIDDAGAVFDSAILTGPAASFQAADSFNRRLEKDVSTGNVPHNFSSGFVWELPRFLRGWKLAAIARRQSGSPLAVTQQPNLNAFAGFGIQRPNRLRDPQLPAAERTLSRWFDTQAFAPAPQFTIGNSSRNPVLGPGYATLDLMLGRTFSLTERLSAEFRAEAFNSTNTPPLGNPNGAFGTPAFGSITTALDPRVYEFVVKLHF
ncbi:MAG: TonB-dependent receptor [Bryobacteraceae bacterium]|nr:TonB-dependent receptor [Bryobacteraceae bacterium]